jgi:hypothetical protein
LNISNKFVDRYRGISNSSAFVLSVAVSFGLALVTGTLSGVAAMYLYDGARSKGDDFGVALGGFFAVGTFVFVVGFTLLQKMHHPVSLRTPFIALCVCLVFPGIATFFSLDVGELEFILGDWLAIALSGLASLVVCRKWLA